MKLSYCRTFCILKEYSNAEIHCIKLLVFDRFKLSNEFLFSLKFNYTRYGIIPNHFFCFPAHQRLEPATLSGIVAFILSLLCGALNLIRGFHAIESLLQVLCYFYNFSRLYLFILLVI